MIKYLLSLLLVSSSLLAQTNLTALSLEEALARVTNSSPALKEAAALVEAARARSRAITFPNPELVARVENAPLRGSGSPDYLAGVSQSIPLGGRIAATREVELANFTHAEKQAHLTLLQVRRKTHSAFATALYSAEALQLASNSLHDAQSILKIAKQRVSAGDMVQSDLGASEAEVLQAQLNLDRAAHLHHHALHVLEVALAIPDLSSVSLQGDLKQVIGIDDINSLVTEFRAAEAISQAEVDRQKARLKAVRAERIPDLNVELLYRRMGAGDQDGVDVGLRLPIPFSKGASAKTAAARAELTAAEAQLEKTRSQNELEEHEIRAHLETALRSSKMLLTEILPRAQKSLQIQTLRFEAGDLSYFDLLPIRRELVRVQQTYLQSLREIIEAWTTFSNH